jgi:hypothetical protein
MEIIKWCDEGLDNLCFSSDIAMDKESTMRLVCLYQVVSIISRTDIAICTAVVAAR